MPMPDPLLEDPDVAAAELALGLLEGDERAAAIRRQLAEPAFARDVERWRDHFALLFADSPIQAPSPGLAGRVERSLERPGDGPARTNRFWRSVGIASSLAAATLAGVLLLRPEPAPRTIEVAARTTGVQLVAALAPTAKGAPLAAYYDAEAQLVRMPAPMPIPAGRSAQLWAISDGKRPVPLGLFRLVGGSVVASAGHGMKIAPGTTLAISFEPVGGSPTGQPTGPVVASGTLSEV